MNPTQLQEILKSIESIHEEVLSIAQTLQNQQNQITPMIQGATVLLAHIKRHEDLIATLQKEIENLKAKSNKQVGF